MGKWMDGYLERLGVIRHGAKLLHSYAHLTCPKVTMVLRRSYGGANIVLGCSRMFPDFIYTWPTAEFAPTGPETVVQAIFHKELAKAKEEGHFDHRTQGYQKTDHRGPGSDRGQTGNPASAGRGTGDGTDLEKIANVEYRIRNDECRRKLLRPSYHT